MKMTFAGLKRRRAALGLLMPVALSLGAASAAAGAEPPPGFERIELTPERTLPIALMSSGQCMISDYDAMSTEFERALIERPAQDDVALVLSLEERTGGTALTPSTLLISEGELSQKRSPALKIPEVREPTAAGIFVCLDGGTGSSRSCAGKTAEPYAQLLQRLKLDIDPKTKHGTVADLTPVRDRIYYYRELVIDGNAVYFPAKGSKKSASDLLASLRKSDSKVPLRRTDKKTEERLKSLTGLGSVPFKKEGEMLVLDLPHFDQVKCAPKPVSKK